MKVGTALMKTLEFTEIIKNADGYFVLVTRERLSNLPYSIHAIYYLNHESYIKHRWCVSSIKWRNWRLYTLSR